MLSLGLGQLRERQDELLERTEALKRERLQERERERLRSNLVNLMLRFEAAEGLATRSGYAGAAKLISTLIRKWIDDMDTP